MPEMEARKESIPEGNPSWVMPEEHYAKNRQLLREAGDLLRSGSLSAIPILVIRPSEPPAPVKLNPHIVTLAESEFRVVPASK